MDIQVSVKNKIATLVTPARIVCGNSDYTITFSFDDEWNGKAVKTARFVYRKDGENKYKEVPFDGDTVAVPVLSGITYVLVGVYAGDLITTVPVEIGCDKSILCGSGKHEDPAPDVYNQLIALIQSGIDGGMPAVTEADNGKFMQVVGGEWAAVSVDNAEGVSY